MKSKLTTGVVLTLALTGMLATTAQAQGEDPADLGRIGVTGSRIKRVDVEGPTPIITITSEQIQQRGYATVLEALDDLSQNAGGGFDQQNTFGFTPSASAIDLRGFGVGRSLVLVDGRRRPVFPIAAGGTTNFTDLSSIPTDFVERIEVLTDGASAIYGSDAVGGVVNIITRRNIEGSQVNLRLGETSDGGARRDRIQLAHGVGSGDNRALFFLEYLDADALMFSDRALSAFDVRGGIGGPGPGIFSSGGFPGTFRGESSNLPAEDCLTTNPGVGVIDGFCRFNRAAFRQLVPEMDHLSLNSVLEGDLNDSISAFGRFGYFTSNVKTQIEPMFFDEGADAAISAEAPNNPTSSVNDPGGVLFGGPQAGTFRRRLVEFGPRTSDIDNNTFSGVVGLRGLLNDRFEWEAGAGYTEQRITGLRGGFARRDAINAAIQGEDLDGDGLGDTGTLNLFDTIPAAVVAQLATEPRTDGLSSVGTIDLQITGDLMDLGVGPLGFAGVVELSRQRFVDRRDPDVLAGNVIALGGSAGGGDRNYSAVGVEFLVPVLDNLNVNVAGRYDNYDDESNVDGAFSPRVALEYRPHESLLLRASAGESFRAPDLQRLFGAQTTGFSDLIDTPQCLADGGTGRGDASVPSCVDPVQSTEVRTGANTALEEEEGENLNFGVVWNPLADLSVTADWFYIKLEKIVNTPTTQFILDANARDGSFADAIVRLASEVTPLNPGGLDVVSSQARNLSFQRVSGLDLGARYRLPFDGFGDFALSFGGTYLDRFEVQENPGDAVVQVLSQGTVGEFARVRATATLEWSRNDLSAALFGDHVGSFTPDDTSSVDRIASWTTWNLTGTWETPIDSQLLVGVTNLFDNDPPLDLSDGNSSQPFYNQFFHDALGQTWFVEYRQNF